jgi:hypothetical protein
MFVLQKALKQMGGSRTAHPFTLAMSDINPPDYTR